MRKYDKNLVTQIHQSDKIISAYGMNVHLKDSPTRKGNGYMDPFELAIMEQNRFAHENEGGNPFEMKLPPEQLIPILREVMGFPNLNLNEKEIITKYETLTWGDNTFGLWRYYPKKGKKTNKPCLICFHGGAWFGGSVYAIENACKLIAELGDAVVFNVEYNLAPEVKFPENLNECYKAVTHVYQHADEYGIDKNRISVAGDSAGANLCAAMCLKDRDENNHYITQDFLIYPAVTFGRNAAQGYNWSEDVYEAAPEHAHIIKESLIFGKPIDLEGNMEAECYFEKLTDATHPYASPMMASDFSGLPKTFIMTAEYDGLRQQGEFYGSQLRNAGVDTTVYRYCGCTHAFLDRLGFQPQTEELCLLIAENL